MLRIHVFSLLCAAFDHGRSQHPYIQPLDKTTSYLYGVKTLYDELDVRDLFIVSVSNSELMPDCFATADCPNADGSNNRVFGSVNAEHPVVIEPTSTVHCQYADSSRLCQYFIGIQIESERGLNGSDSVLFSVSFSSSDATSGQLLFGGAPTTSRFVGGDDEYHFYESYLPESAQSAEVSLQSCSGNVDLFVSPTSVFPTKLTADFESTHSAQLDVVTVPNVEYQGIKALYIGVRDDSPSRDSEYALSVGDEVDRFRPMVDAADLVVSSLQRGEAVVTLKVKRFPDDLRNGEDAEGFAITVIGYTLYFGDDSNPYSMSSHCGLHRMASEWSGCPLQSTDGYSCSVDLGVGPNGDDVDFIETTVRGLTADSIYSFNVELQAAVQREDGSGSNDVVTVYTVYNGVAVRIASSAVATAPDPEAVGKLSAGNEMALEVAFGVSIPALFILIGFAIFYYKKHERVQHDLAVLEMEEVPLRKIVKAVGGTQFADDEPAGSKAKTATFGSRLRAKHKMKGSRRPRESAKKYHSLLSAQDDDDDEEEDAEFVEDDQAAGDSLSLQIDHDDNERNVVF